MKSHEGLFWITNMTMKSHEVVVTDKFHSIVQTTIVGKIH